jgi:hypothetical protein
MNLILDFILKNKKTLIAIIVFILMFILFGLFSNKYHKKEIKILEKQIAEKEVQFQEVVKEKEKLQDSSEYYEAAAYKADLAVAQTKAKAEKLRKEKDAALAALHNLPKEVIDSFFVKRYVNIKKSGIDLSLDKNVGNEVVKELTEKDYLVTEIAIEKDQNKLLFGQVDTLKTSLIFSKSALIKADSAIRIKTQQLQISKNLVDLLEQDLKTAKRKAFWGRVKGVGIGVAAGVVAGILIK